MYPCVPRPSHTQGVTSVNLWTLALFGEGIPGAGCLERGLGRGRGGGGWRVELPVVTVPWLSDCSLYKVVHGRLRARMGPPKHGVWI